MGSRLPLHALLSQAFVAFTIEFDNEFERQMPHRTTRYGASGGRRRPWLVSMAMWLKFLRHVPPEGISIEDLQPLAGLDRKRLAAWLTRMSKWWGYVTVDRAGVVRPTADGREAQEVWRPLAATIERRWEERFGKHEIGEMRESLSVVVKQLDPGLPDYLPILGYGLFSVTVLPAHRASAPAAAAGLPALLAKTLLAFAVEFEQDSEISLAITANVIRLTGAEPARIAELPRLAGVSKEGIEMCLSFLERHGYARIASDPVSRRKLLTLTAAGRAARDRCMERTGKIENGWRERFGEEAIRALRQPLEAIVTEPLIESLLYTGIRPFRDGWRAALPPPETLPHYPMVLHRGGYPDGS